MSWTSINFAASFFSNLGAGLPGISAVVITLPGFQAKICHGYGWKNYRLPCLYPDNFAVLVLNHPLKFDEIQDEIVEMHLQVRFGSSRLLMRGNVTFCALLTKQFLIAGWGLCMHSPVAWTSIWSCHPDISRPSGIHASPHNYCKKQQSSTIFHDWNSGLPRKTSILHDDGLEYHWWQFVFSTTCMDPSGEFLIVDTRMHPTSPHQHVQATISASMNSLDISLA